VLRQKELLDLLFEHGVVGDRGVEEVASRKSPKEERDEGLVPQ